MGGQYVKEDTVFNDADLSCISVVLEFKSYLMYLLRQWFKGNFVSDRTVSSISKKSKRLTII